MSDKHFVSSRRATCPYGPIYYIDHRIYQRRNGRIWKIAGLNTSNFRTGLISMAGLDNIRQTKKLVITKWQH